jgi:hypothetical protein
MIRTALLLAASLLPALASASPCVDHFTVSGGLLKGTQYSSWDEFKGDPDTTLIAIGQAAGMAGWNNLVVNDKLRMVTANMQSAMGKSSTNPLSVVVKTVSPSSVRVEGTIATAALQKASAGSVRDALCRLLEAR